MPFIQETVLNFKRKHSVQKDQCTENVNHIKVNKNRNPYIALTFKGIVNIKNNKILVIWHRHKEL